jgi:hypothetical protein
VDLGEQNKPLPAFSPVHRCTSPTCVERQVLKDAVATPDDDEQTDLAGKIDINTAAIEAAWVAA